MPARLVLALALTATAVSGCGDLTSAATPVTAAPTAPTGTPTGTPAGTPAGKPTPEAHARTRPARTTYDRRFAVTQPWTDPLFRRPLRLAGSTPVLVTYSAYLQGIGDDASPSDPLKGECYVVQGRSPDFDDRTFYTADDSAVSVGDDLSFSGSGVIDPAQGEAVFLECELDEGRPRQTSWTTNPDEPIQVTVTPLQGYVRRVH